MEGRYSLPRFTTKGQVPSMCAIAFLAGCVYEITLCVSGFYNVYTYKAAEKSAVEKLEDEDFWERVKLRREAKKAAGLINLDENEGKK